MSDADPVPSAPAPRLAILLDLLGAGVGIRSLAISVLALLGVLYTLYFAKAFILPIVLAILLSLLLAPVVSVLYRRMKIPTGIAAAIVLAALLGSIALAAAFVVEPANAWIQTIPSRIPDLKYRLKDFQKPLEKVREASKQVEQFTNMGTAPDQPVAVERGATAAGVVMSQTPAFLANLFVMFILLYFMLASGDLFLRKLVRMIPSFQDKRRAVQIAHDIEQRISRYLLTVTAINAGLGLAVGAAAALVGLNNFVLWGVLAFVLNFVPYLGALVGIGATLLVGLLSFESTSHAFLMPAIYFGLTALEGNFITPMIVGRILTLNPVMIFLSLMFWGWIWGIAGALLAVPILAILKIACDHLPPLAPFGTFIGGENDSDAVPPEIKETAAGGTGN